MKVRNRRQNKKKIHHKRVLGQDLSSECKIKLPGDAQVKKVHQSATEVKVKRLTRSRVIPINQLCLHSLKKKVRQNESEAKEEEGLK